MCRFRIVIFLIFFSVIGLGVVILGYFTISVQNQVKEKFGPPALALGTFQHYRLALVILSNSDDLLFPVNAEGDALYFTIEPNETTNSIIQRLLGVSLITNPDAFRSYLIYTGMDTRLKPGDYILNPDMSPIEIAQTIQSLSNVVTFRVLPGWRIEEITAALPTSGLIISPDEFLAAASFRPIGYSFSSDVPLHVSTEGFLFPDVYNFPRDITTDRLIASLLENFDIHFTADLRQGVAQQELDLFQAVTLASIIQREAVVVDELPLIASVYLNRLKTGMKLQADPTVQYAIGYENVLETWWKSPLSLTDLQFESLYNTYLYHNLPPGPISNPGLSAILAVAFPVESNYYFFRAACDGSGNHVFAMTFIEHQENACP